jgi:cell division protein FtsB
MSVAGSAVAKFGRSKAQESGAMEELAQLKDSVYELEQTIEKLDEEVSLEKRRAGALMLNFLGFWKLKI